MTLHDNDCEGSTEDCCCAYRKEIAALTKERDELKARLWACNEACKDIQHECSASHAREAKLREALIEISNGKFPKDEDEYPDDSMRLFARDALDLPADDTALQQRLAQERERCAKIAETAAHKLGGYQFAADAIRSLK